MAPPYWTLRGSFGWLHLHYLMYMAAGPPTGRYPFLR